MLFLPRITHCDAALHNCTIAYRMFVCAPSEGSSQQPRSQQFVPGWRGWHWPTHASNSQIGYGLCGTEAAPYLQHPSRWKIGLGTGTRIPPSGGLHLITGSLDVALINPAPLSFCLRSSADWCGLRHVAFGLQRSVDLGALLLWSRKTTLRWRNRAMVHYGAISRDLS